MPEGTCYQFASHLIWGSTHRRAIKEGSKVLNHNWVNNHACSLPQNIHVTACLYVASDNLTSIFRHCTVPRMLRRICLTLALAPHKRPERNQQHRTISGGFRILSGPLWPLNSFRYFLKIYTVDPLSRLRLSRITGSLEVKFCSLFKHETLTRGNKILWKRGEIAPLEQFLLFFTIFLIYL